MHGLRGFAGFKHAAEGTADAMMPAGKKARGDGAGSPPPDLARLTALIESIPVLQPDAKGIDEIVPAHLDHRYPAGPNFLPGELRLVANVDMDEGATAVLVEDNEALGSTGAATCYVIAGRGVNQSGKTVLALSHVSSLAKPQEVIDNFDRVMGGKGCRWNDDSPVKPYDMFILGGQLCLQVDDEDPGRVVEGTLDHGVDLIARADKRVTAARIGLSETKPEDQDDGVRLWASTGRPRSVTVVITQSHVYYAPDPSIPGDDSLDVRIRVEEAGRRAKAGQFLKEGGAPIIEPPDLGELERFKATTFSGESIIELKAGDGLPLGTRVVENVELDCEEVSIVKAVNGAALGSTGAATCYVVAARGIDQDGATVLAMMHLSSVDDIKALFDDAMREQGVNWEPGEKGYDMYIVGGQVSVLIDEADPRRIIDGSLENGMKLVEFGKERITDALIGLAESQLEDVTANPGCRLFPTGRPEGVTVVITDSHVYYAREERSDIAEPSALTKAVEAAEAVEAD